jgi:hypothetical protein
MLAATAEALPAPALAPDPEPEPEPQAVRAASTITPSSPLAAQENPRFQFIIFLREAFP